MEWHQQYQDIVREGRVANPPLIPPPDAPKKRGRKRQTKAQNLIERLEKYEEFVLAFLHDFQIPFTNNQGEQDTRMQKVMRKVSGCFRTFEGAELFALIRSYISTVRKQDRSVFQELKAACTEIPSSQLCICQDNLSSHPHILAYFLFLRVYLMGCSLHL